MKYIYMYEWESEIPIKIHLKGKVTRGEVVVVWDVVVVVVWVVVVEWLNLFASKRFNLKGLVVVVYKASRSSPVFYVSVSSSSCAISLFWNVFCTCGASCWMWYKLVTRMVNADAIWWQGWSRMMQSANFSGGKCDARMW